MNNRKLYQKNWFILMTIYLVAVLVRIAAVYIVSWDKGAHFENYQIASYIIAGKGYWWNWGGTIPPQATALLPPIYTYFLVIFMSLFDYPFRIIYIAQSFLNSLGILPSFYLGKQLGDRKVAIVAAGLYAFFPEIAFTPTRLISEPLFVPCLVLIFYLFLKFKSKLIITGSYRQFFWLGIVLGLTTLIKTTGLLVALACFTSLILIKKNRKAICLAALMLGIGFFMATFPWNLRNLIVMKKPMMFTSNFGYNLWRGNHPWGSGTEYLDRKRFSEAELSPEYIKYLELNRPKTEVELDKFYLNEAIKFIKQNPKRYARLTLKRMIYFITIDPTHPLTNNIVYIGGYIFVLLFGIWGAVLLNRKKRLASIFIITPLFFFCFYTPIIMLPRFRLVAILILLVFSSIPIAQILSKNKSFNRLVS